MATIPAPLIPAPQPIRARRYGLFDAAAGPLDLPRYGEGGGVRYVPDGCGQAYAWGVNCYTGDDEPPAKPLDADNDLIDTGVFAVLSTVLCSAVGYSMDEYAAKAQRRLEGSEQAAVERAFWSGLDQGGNALDIRSISAAAETVVVDEQAALTEVVGQLERWLYADQGYGPTGYLHAPIELAAFAAEAGLVLADSNRKVTPLGTVWSFGAYPAGSIAITGQTTVWRGPVSTYQAFESATNEVFTVAERAYAVSFDCFAGVAEFDPLEVTSP